MITRYEHRGVKWIDLESPTADEIEEVAQELNLTSALAQDLLAPTQKPRVDLYPNVAYAVLHFPSLRHTRGVSETQEVDFVISDKFILTAHYDAVSAVYDFSRAFEADSLLRHSGNANFKSGHILLELAERLYQSVENELESVEDSISFIEREIFAGHEKEMVRAISRASRELLNQKRTLSNHTAVLDALEQMSIMTFGEEYGNYLRGVKLFHSRVYAHALSLTETVNELRDTNMGLLYTRQNEVMKTLTIMTFVTAPLAVIASVFGMNTIHTPVLGSSNDFWVIIGGMLLLAALFFTYFKFRKWF